ncbi:hypothetical protein TNCV_626651 [Trichonephila clavipes]|nr:hypothetical protein TNCV_626651 [Trichonephila clavipes]
MDDPIHYEQNNLNSNMYVHEVLQPEVVPFLQSTPGAIFQQDNERLHVAKTVQDYPPKERILYSFKRLLETHVTTEHGSMRWFSTPPVLLHFGITSCPMLSPSIYPYEIDTHLLRSKFPLPSSLAYFQANANSAQHSCSERKLSATMIPLSISAVTSSLVIPMFPLHSDMK